MARINEHEHKLSLILLNLYCDALAGAGFDSGPDVVEDRMRMLADQRFSPFDTPTIAAGVEALIELLTSDEGAHEGASWFIPDYVYGSAARRAFAETKARPFMHSGVDAFGQFRGLVDSTQRAAVLARMDRELMDQIAIGRGDEHEDHKLDAADGLSARELRSCEDAIAGMLLRIERRIGTPAEHGTDSAEAYRFRMLLSKLAWIGDHRAKRERHARPACDP